jgi:hypothetical protein
MTSIAEASRALTQAILSERPFLASRFGTTELAILNRHRQARGDCAPLPVTDAERTAIRTLSGVFPTDDATLRRFCRRTLDDVATVDLLAVRDSADDLKARDSYCRRACMIPLVALSPVEIDQPWSNALAGQKVLVIHPFASTIRMQYEKGGAVLFGDARVLPRFEIEILHAVQSLGSASDHCGYNSWFDALKWMEDQIDASDSRIVLVGAGAYGLPLAAAAKGMGKCAIHMGGALQLLFGIRGQRWENYTPVRRWYNDCWTWPLAVDIPLGFEMVEGGCYWKSPTTGV